MPIPQTLAEALKFSMCQQYKSWHICIYAGGHDEMFWGYIVYDTQGDRYAWDRLPSNCLDVDDGQRYCEQLIDKWEAPLTYEEIRLWRDICELLWNLHGEASYWYPTTTVSILRRVPGCEYLIKPERSRRQLLWEKFTIQLITWQKNGKNDGWCLKGNWEYKINFLEQVFILGRDPETLPRTWLIKWENKQQQEKQRLKYSELKQHLYSIRKKLEFLEWEKSEFTDFTKNLLNGITEHCQIAKQLLKEIEHG